MGNVNNMEMMSFENLDAGQVSKMIARATELYTTSGAIIAGDKSNPCKLGPIELKIEETRRGVFTLHLALSGEFSRSTHPLQREFDRITDNLDTYIRELKPRPVPAKNR